MRMHGNAKFQEIRISRDLYLCVSFLVWFKMNQVLLLLAQGFIPYVNVADIRNYGI